MEPSTEQPGFCGYCKSPTRSTLYDTCDKCSKIADTIGLKTQHVYCIVCGDTIPSGLRMFYFKRCGRHT